MTAQSRSVVVRLTAETAQYIAQMQAAGTMTADAMTKAERSTMSHSRALTTMGSAGGKAGLVAAAGLGAIVVATARFDKAMSAVQAATHETTGNMEDLRSAAVKAGADTVFSATEAAGAIENLAKAGVGTQDILSGGLSGSLDLAAAGSLDVADAAEIAATALTQFKLQGEDIPHVADLLAAGAGKAQGEVSDLAMALKQSGLVASQMGLSIEETTGTLAAFASAGLLGSDAGTSFRTMLLRLANPTQESADLMQSLGIQAYDAQGKFVGMASVAQQLKVAFEGKTQAERDSALATIFGSDAIRAASVLYAQGSKGIDDWTSKVNDQGYAAETAATKLDNLSGDLEQFKGSLETALIGAGDGSQGMLRGLVQDATAATNAFNKLPAAGKNAATGLLAITAVTGGALWFGAKVINGVANTREALSELGVQAGTTSKAMSAIGKGVEFYAMIEGVKLLDDELADLANARLDDTNLSRNLTALADGRVVDNLDKIGGYIRSINSSMAQGTDKAFGWLPGKTEFSEAKDEVEKLDQALAAMVEGGSADEAAAAMAQITKMAGEQGISVSETTKWFDQYNLALDNMGSKGTTSAAAVKAATFGLIDVEGAASGAAIATGDYSVAANLAAKAAAEQARELRKARDAARGTAQSFVGLGDSLNDSKVSLHDWIAQLEHQADALRNFRVNASEAADKGLRKGLIGALRDAGTEGALRMRQLAHATDAEIDRANAAWKRGRNEVDRYTDAVGGVPDAHTTDLNVDAGQSMATINGIRFAIDQLRNKTVYLTTVSRRVGPGGQGNGYDPSARGNIFPSVAAYAGGGMDRANAHSPEMTSGGITRVWNEPETGGESYIPLANDARRPRAKGILEDTAAMFGGRVEWFAKGGIAGGARSTEDALAIAQALKEIRDLRRQLNADGKNKLEGLNRRIAQLQLEAAEKELRLAKTREAREARQAEAETRRNVRGLMSGFSLDNIVPDETPATAAGQVAAELDQLKASILDAGGTWTQAMRRWAADLVATAGELDTVKASLAAETEKRDQLLETLASQQQALDQLTSTMESYASSVAGNFLHDPFNGAHTVTSSGPVGGGAASGPLAEAEAQLAAIRNSATGDSVESAAAASRLIAQIAQMRSADGAADPAASGLQALHDTLVQDTQAAQAMSAALATLAEKGLDTTGTLGGLYQQLAASGDVATAEELAALSAEQIDEYEKLFAAREDAAALVAAQATQAVYGQQQAELTALISATTDAITLSEATIAVLNGQIAVLGEQVRQGAQDGMEPVEVEMGGIRKSIGHLAREFAEQAKKQRV